MAESLSEYEKIRLQRVKENDACLLKTLDLKTRRAELVQPSSSKTKGKRSRKQIESSDNDDDGWAPVMKDAPRSSRRAKKRVSYDLKKLPFSPQEMTPQKKADLKAVTVRAAKTKEKVIDSGVPKRTREKPGEQSPVESAVLDVELPSYFDESQDPDFSDSECDDDPSDPERDHRHWKLHSDMEQHFNSSGDESHFEGSELDESFMELHERVKRMNERFKLPSRSKAGMNTYQEEDLSDDDEYLWPVLAYPYLPTDCEECGQMKGDCLEHGALTPLDETQGKDSQSTKHTSVFVPKQVTVRESSIPNSGLGVFATELMANRVLCGPYKGTIVPKEDVGAGVDTAYMWELRRSGHPGCFVDGKDLSTANWMRYVNCARSEAEQNMVAFQYKGNMFYRTYRPIQPGEELLVWYGDEYARELGIDVRLPLDNDSSDGEDEEEVSDRNGLSIAYTYLGCVSAFVEQQSFNIHLKNNTSCDLANPQAFTCQKCGVTFGQLFQLQFHTRQHLATPPEEQGNGSTTSPVRHTGDKPYKCTYCDYCCSTSGYLKTHLRTHTGDKPYKCTFCDYCCSTSGNLKTHLRTHTGDKPYKCTYCDYCCNQSGSLKTHLSTHTGDKPYKCTYCDYCCSNSGRLKRHLRTHTGDKPYKCTFCDYCCSTSGNLKTHLRTHTGDKPYKCTYCDYCCSNSGSLKTHLRTHTGDKPYKCTYCDYCCSQSGDLRKHLRTHTGDKPYKCTYCDYCCSQSGNLKTHLRTHTGDKPYKCTYCDYCCSNSGDLNRHLRTHTGDKPYKCTYCDYCCSDSGSLGKHLRTHTGDKPYKCTYCDYCSSQNGSLKAHLRTHLVTSPTSVHI